LRRNEFNLLTISSRSVTIKPTNTPIPGFTLTFLLGCNASAVTVIPKSLLLSVTDCNDSKSLLALNSSCLLGRDFVPGFLGSVSVPVPVMRLNRKKDLQTGTGAVH
jgi:hypothetical protein